MAKRRNSNQNRNSNNNKENKTNGRNKVNGKQYGSEKRGAKESSDRKDSQGDSSGYGDSNNQQQGEEVTDNPKVGSTTNDPEWYSKFPTLVSDTCNIPFSNPLGAPFNTIGTHGSYVPNTDVYISDLAEIESIAGLMVIQTKPSLGYNDGMYDAANVAATAMYSFIRILNNGRKNYEVPDLMMYDLSITDIYAAIIFCERIYAFAFLYSQRNWYIGKDLIKACGVDPDSVISNLANFREEIKILISKIAAYAIPGDINILRRRVFMYSSIYLENPDGLIKDQLYMFKPDGFFTFTLDSRGKGMLAYSKYTGTSTSPITVDALMSYVHNLLNNIYGDEDFAIMSGDIRRSYGDNIMGLPPLPDDFLVVPTYDPDVLYQIHNMNIIGSTCREGSTFDSSYIRGGETYHYGNIYQDAHGVIVSREAMRFDPGDQSLTGKLATIARKLELCSHRILDSDKTEVSPTDVMESTRLQACYKRTPASTESSDYNKVYEMATGSDVVIEVDIYYNIGKESGLSNAMTIVGSNQVVLAASGNLPITFTRIFDFAYGPIMNFVSVETTDYTIVASKIIGNLRNVTTFDSRQLQRMHDVALLSLFWVPGVTAQI